MAVAVGIGGQFVVVFPAIGSAGQALAPVLDPADRVAQMAREVAGDDFLRHQHALIAEPAADIGRHHADRFLRQAEAFREAGADDMRHLRRGMEHDLLQPAVPFGDQPAALDRRHMLAGRAQAAAYDDRRAVADGVLADIGAAFEEDIVAPMVVQQRRARRAPGQHVADGREFLVTDFDQLRQILRRRAGGGDADGDRLADMAHAVGGEDGLGGGFEAGQGGDGGDRLHDGQIGRGEHGVLEPGGFADGVDAGMAERAADEGEVLHAGEADIGDELAAPAQIAVILLAQDGAANAFARGRAVHAHPLMTRWGS